MLNNHFVDNTKQGKTDKDKENRPIIDHLNESFQVKISNEPEKTIDEHMTKHHLALQQWHGWCRCNGSKNSCLQT